MEKFCKTRKQRSSPWTNRKNRRQRRPIPQGQPTLRTSWHTSAPIWFSPCAIFTAHSIDALCLVTYSEIASGLGKKGAFMAVQKTEKIWHNGKWINWDDAQLHVFSHVVSYGSAVFEGIRCYETKQGPAIFRLGEHMQRLINSAKIYRMDLPYSVDDFSNVACELVRHNKLNSCYVKPIVLRGYGEVGVNPLNSPIDCYMACWSWGAYLGPEALTKGVDIGVSSWTRIAPNTLPAMSKAAANYMNSQLIRMEATFNGYAEGIALDAHGHVSEGSGMN